MFYAHESDNKNSVTQRIIRQDTKELRTLVEEYGINGKFKGQTLLYIAAEQGALDSVKFFLNCENIEINTKSSSFGTALHAAVKSKSTNKEEVIKLLLQQKNIDINAVDGVGDTPLNVVLTNELSENNSQIGSPQESQLVSLIKMATLLIKHGADLNKKNSQNQSPLYNAIAMLENSSKGFTEDELVPLVKLMLKKGANITIMDNNNTSHIYPDLHLTIRLGAPKILKVLLQHEKISHNIFLLQYAIECFDNNLNNPQDTLYKNSKSIIKLLTKTKQDISLLNNKNLINKDTNLELNRILKNIIKCNKASLGIIAISAISAAVIIGLGQTNAITLNVPLETFITGTALTCVTITLITAAINVVTKYMLRKSFDKNLDNKLNEYRENLQPKALNSEYPDNNINIAPSNQSSVTIPN